MPLLKAVALTINPTINPFNNNMLDVVSFDAAVDALSKSGYELVETREIELPIDFSGRYGAPHVEKVRSVLLIMRLSEESSLAALTKELTAVRAQLTAAEGKLAETTKALGIERDHLRRVERARDTAIADRAESGQVCERFRALNVLLEADIGAIRKEIGDARMRAILAAHKQS